VKGYTGMPDWWNSWMQNAWGDKNTNWFQGAANTQDAYKNYFSRGPKFGDQVGQNVNQMQDTFSKYFGGGPKYQDQTDQMVGQLPSAWTAYQGLPGQIENQRKTMIDQIYANLPQMRELYQPTMESMSQRGILNSDVTGNALSEIQKGVNRDVGSQVAGANTWAGDQNIAQTQGMSGVLNNIINGMLGASGQYTGFGTSALGGAGNVAGNTMNASNLYSGFGKDAASIGNAQQGGIYDLIKMLQNQTTYNV
jgi:hypothetical protein